VSRAPTALDTKRDCWLEGQ